MKLARPRQPTGREATIARHVENGSGVQVEKFGHLSGVEDGRVLPTNGFEAVGRV